MSDVKIPFGTNPKDTAVLLLAAAEDLDRPRSDVRATTGAFVVDEEIAKKAGFGEKDEPKAKAESKPEPKAEEKVADDQPAKKAAKKSTKKAAAKKAAKK